MRPQPASIDDEARLATLRRYELRDTGPDPALDELTALAGRICETPISLVSLVDARRQWFKSGAIASVVETPRHVSFCGRAIVQSDVFVVEDAAADERFAENPLVTGDARVRFYAGAPLITAEGHALGTLCVLDRAPRRLSSSQNEALGVLGRQVMARLDLQRRTRELVESETRLRMVTENARVGLVLVNTDRRYEFANSTYAEILGLSPDIVGRRVADVLPGVYENQIRPWLDRAFAGERVGYELHKPSSRGEGHYAVRYEPKLVDGAVALVGVVITDVTEYRLAVAASSRLAAIVESSVDAIIGKDPNGVITSWNAGAEKLFGYKSAEIVGDSILRLIPEDRWDEEVGILEKIRRGESVEHFETQRHTKDGRLIDVAVTASPIKDASGAIVGASKVARDVSERKRADAALRHERDRAQQYLDTAGVILLALDMEGRITLVNRYACAAFGWTAEELLGRDFIDTCVPARIRLETRDKLRTVQAGDDSIVENPIVTKSGDERLIEWRTAFLRDDTGRVIGTLSSGADITERHAAIEALRTTEERTRFALQNANVGIWDMDYSTGVLRWSETLEGHYGLRPGTFPGTFEAFLEYIHPDDRASALERVRKAMESGTDFSVEHRTIWPDGTVRWLAGAGRILLDQHGEPARGVGISLDVTDHRKLEEQYHQAQKMEAVGRLAGGVAHDFNNILTAILLSSELLLADREEDDPDRTDIIEIQKAATRAAGLTSQLLAFSRKQIIEPTMLDLNAVIGDLRAMLQRLIGEDVEVATNLCAALWPVKADRGQMEQIVLNLAVNARDAMPRGGLLTIETANIELDEDYARTHLDVKPGSHVVLRVTDTGTGMTPEVQKRLFEPFFTTKEVGKGTGLGLATVHGIVLRSGGSVGVYSEIGKGSSFNVYFPRADADTATHEIRPSVRPDAGGETILVVEDSEALRDLAKRILERQGYTVLVAASADEAIRLFGENAAIDVLLTDVVMPGMSGPDLTEQLVERRPALTVIYMSGYTEEAVTHHGVLKPGIEFLHKPFTSETLGRKIREAIDRESKARS